MDAFLDSLNVAEEEVLGIDIDKDALEHSETIHHKVILCERDGLARMWARYPRIGQSYAE